MPQKKQSLEDDLGLSLIKTLGTSDLSSISEDLIEVGLDSLLQDGILKDIPIIGTIIGVGKSVISIRDKFLTRKVLDFLQGLNNISDEERRKFLKDIDGDTNYQRRVGENLVMLLDRLDDLNKPAMVVKLFRSYLRDEITYNEFLWFASVIERAFINDLVGLLERMSQASIYGIDLYAERLYHLGLSQINFDDSIYQRIGNGLDNMTLGSVSSMKNLLHKPLQFVLSNNAYLLAQILLDKKIVGVDYIELHRRDREYGESHH
jgi:hypothetical protein